MSAIRAGDAVMVKGSLGSRMAPIVKALQRLSARRDNAEPGTLRTASAQG
jgi:UDP-N-acetylmuramoyl-tripeptide--D-alanyl-D-alanine ligase